MTVFHGTIHNDVFDESGDTGSDTFDLYKGGEDTVIAGSGDDIINMGASLDAGDRLNGGAGRDIVTLRGDYSAGLVFDDQTIQNIDVLQLHAGFNYNLTTADGNVAAGHTLGINATHLGAGNSLTFDGSAETDGHFLIYAGAGDDTLTGGAKADVFHLEQGGNDTAHGGGGADTFDMGAAFTSGDVIDGGAGNDTLVLNGDYSGGYTFAANQLTSIETLKLDGGHSYQLTWDDSDLAAGQTLTVDGSAMSGSDGLFFNGGTETDGNFHIIVGAGENGFFLAGGSGNDTFDLTGIPVATTSFLEGGDGDDTILFGANFNNVRFATFSGNAGNDTIELNGDYSSLTFGLGISSIETFRFDSGHSYGNVQVSETGVSGVTVDASHVSTLFHLTFGNSDATVEVGSGGMDANPLNATAQNDTFVVTSEAALAASAIDAGAGTDTLELNGDFSTPTLVLEANVKNFENLTLEGAANSYNIAVGDGIASTLTVDASTAAGLTFVATSDATTAFVVTGSAGNDTIAGGTLADTIAGGAGADMLTGGGGADIFDYGSAADSNTAGGYDTITDLSSSDSIHIAGLIPTYFTSAFISTYQGSLDADLAFGSTGMPAGTYMTVTSLDSSDPFFGREFLVIDGNHTAGYQPGADYVIDITGYGDPSTIHFV